MKKLFFLLIAVLISASAFSQSTANGLRVHNLTNCPQHYQVLGSTKHCECIEVPHYMVTNIITIAPMSSDYHPGDIVAARIPETLGVVPGCNPPWPGGTVGQPVCFQLSFTFIPKLENCVECGAHPSTTATWTPATHCDQEARLTFTP